MTKQTKTHIHRTIRREVFSFDRVAWDISKAPRPSADETLDVYREECRCGSIRYIDFNQDRKCIEHAWIEKAGVRL